MSIDHKTDGNAEAVAENDIRGFSTDAGKRQEFRHRLRDFAVESFENFTAAPLNTFCLVAIKSGAFDRRFNVRDRCFRKRPNGRKSPEQMWCDLIDPNIGTLRRKDGRHQ